MESEGWMGGISEESSGKGESGKGRGRKACVLGCLYIRAHVKRRGGERYGEDSLPFFSSRSFVSRCFISPHPTSFLVFPLLSLSTHTHTQIHTCIHTYTHAFTHPHTHVRTHKRTHSHTHTLFSTPLTPLPSSVQISPSIFLSPSLSLDLTLQPTWSVKPY